MPIFCFAQKSELENVAQRDTLSINMIRIIPTSKIERVTHRLMSSYPDLISIEINPEAKKVEIVYAKRITDIELNQIINYFN
jgi:hypothetical protein